MKQPYPGRDDSRLTIAGRTSFLACMQVEERRGPWWDLILQRNKDRP
jgi:hypothetical protein